MRFICTSGVVASGQSGCPAAGTVLSTSCGTDNATDAYGTVWTVGVTEYVKANGYCGTYVEKDPPADGVCGFPPSGWVTDYFPTYVSTNDIYWSHPSNPDYGNLASGGINILISYSITFWVDYLSGQSSTTGWSAFNGELIYYVSSANGWYLKYYRDSVDPMGYYTIEDNIPP